MDTRNQIPVADNLIQFPGMPASLGGPERGQAIVDDKGPIEQKMRAVLAQLKGTNYPDTFDWSVYDRIASRFPEPPRGGVVFNTTFKLVNQHSSCTKCHYAFELDTYGRGCFHECAYCYAKGQLVSYGYWNRPQPFPVNLAEIRKTFFTVFETNRSNQWREVMEQRIPLRIGSMSDSFMYMDSKYGITKELLKILKFYRYPYIIFTRSDLVAHDDYLELLDSRLAAIQFSISGNNQNFIRQIEPGAPSYKRRLRALEKLANEGHWTSVRINPLFPKFPDGYYTDQQSVISRFGSLDRVPQMPFYDDCFVSELAAAKVPSIVAGVVRLSPWAINSMSRAIGSDIREFFKPDLFAIKGDKRFSNAEVLHYYQWFRSECQKHDMRFSTCYIGNGIRDYFQYQDMWTNKSDCCDAMGNVGSFKNSSQSISWDTRIRCSKNPEAARASKALDDSASLDSQTLDADDPSGSLPN